MNKRRVIVYTSFIIALLILIFLNISIGSMRISMSDITAILSGQDLGSTNAQIILSIRLPRLISAAVLGGALAVSGYMLQTFFHNSIAGPYVLGISSGAKLMVAMLMVFSTLYGFYVSAALLIISAFIGALIVTAFVLIVSTKIKQMSVLIVCGVMIGYMCSALTELMISFAADSNIVNLHAWSLGSFSGASLDNIKHFLPVVFVCMVLALLLSKQMEVYSYGEDYAKTLGMNVRAFKVFLIIISSILSATVTAFAGPVSFVGIAVPHLVRISLKSDRPVMVIPAAFILGSVFCLLSDLLARSLFAPAELSISTMTAIILSPVVIAMMINKKKN